jgi:hypothetical protein
VHPVAELLLAVAGSLLLITNECLVVSLSTCKTAHLSGKFIIAAVLIKNLFQEWLKLAVAAIRETRDQ